MDGEKTQTVRIISLYLKEYMMYLLFFLDAPSVSEVLRFVRADIITNTQCNKDYQGFVKSSNICANGAGGKSSCNGDSGGPLTVNDNGTTKQVGIVSFGRVEGCERGFAHVYTRVTSFLDWIQQNSDVVIN